MNYQSARGAVVARSAAIVQKQTATSTSAKIEERTHPIFRFPNAAIIAMQKKGRNFALSCLMRWRHSDTSPTFEDASLFLDRAYDYFKRYEINKDA